MKRFFSRLMGSAQGFNFFGKRTYFCPEPWTGIFSVRTNQDVIFCPCYLQLKLGNLNQSSMRDLWNAPALIDLRKSFRRGKLPEGCSGQLCPVARGKQR
jgi:hypothetical protein